MKSIILMPLGKNGQSVFCKSMQEAISFLGCSTTEFNIALAKGTLMNGFFIDYAISDEYGIPDCSVLNEINKTVRLHAEKKGVKLNEWLERRQKLIEKAAKKKALFLPQANL